MSTDKAKEELREALTEKITGGANIVNNSDREYEDATQTLIDNLWPFKGQEMSDAMNKLDKTVELIKDAVGEEQNGCR